MLTSKSQALMPYESQKHSLKLVLPIDFLSFYTFAKQVMAYSIFQYPTVNRRVSAANTALNFNTTLV
ncbi:MAG: hypothetical protein ACI9DJ_002473 [Algoriphagus sp.]|jgi:hypothetical protein